MFGKIESWLMSKADALVLSIHDFSFEVCLLIGLIALMLYIFGYKKGVKIATISPAVYVILQIFLEVWFGV